MIYTEPIHSIISGRIQEPPLPSESKLVAYWTCIRPGTVLKDRNGNLVTIFSPGRRNKNEGPDFLDAVIWIAGELKKGAVEIHGCESAWNRHGHHGNHRYHGVILHVVARFAKQPVLNVPTIQLEVLDLKSNKHCLLPNQSITTNQQAILMELSLKRWDEKVFHFKQGVPERKKRIFIESLANFGSGENRVLYRKLGDQLFPFLSDIKSPEDWLDTFTEISSQFHWHRSGVMPARYPQKILNNIGIWCYDMFIQQTKTLSLMDLKGHFKNRGFGQGTWVEWCGNVYFPAKASKKSNDYAAYLERWLALKLPTPYGGLKRFFDGKLTRQELRSFPLAQGLLYLRNHYCTGWHCDLCMVRQTL